jgi:PilZ domain
MSIDRRKHVRHDVNYSCWFSSADASQLIEARVRNISEGGMKVVCPAHDEVPDTIDLYMTRDRKVARRCKIVWRSEDALGLAFVTKTPLRQRNGTVELI